MIKRPNRRARVKARRSAVQALYQHFITDKDIADVIAEFHSDDKKLIKADIDYFKRLLTGVAMHCGEFDELLLHRIDRPVAELDAIERAILRIGCYELKYQPDIPYRVILNESIELAKLFGAEQSHKYINAVLDKVAQQIRATEINHGI